MGYQRAFATLVMGRTVSADDARVRLRQRGGGARPHRGRGAQGRARDLRVAAESVAISRKLLNCRLKI